MDMQEKYTQIEVWLNSLEDKDLEVINDSIHSNNIDREFTIETILEDCSCDDDVLLDLYDKSNNIQVVEIPLEKAQKTLEEILDWFHYAPMEEIEKVQIAIEWDFPYDNIVRALVSITGKTYIEIVNLSQKRNKE